MGDGWRSMEYEPHVLIRQGIGRWMSTRLPRAKCRMRKWLVGSSRPSSYCCSYFAMLQLAVSLQAMPQALHRPFLIVYFFFFYAQEITGRPFSIAWYDRA